MEIEEKINSVFESNLIIAKQIGDKNIISIIEGIQKEINDVIRRIKRGKEMKIDFENLKITGLGPARTRMMKLANSEEYVEVENPEYTKLKDALEENE